LNGLIEGKTDTEEMFEPLVSVAVLRGGFLSSAIVDLVEGGLAADDVTPMFGPLKVLARFHPSAITTVLAQLSAILAGGAVARQLAVRELDGLARLIVACIP
jgi:hypothetical protein